MFANARRFLCVRSRCSNSTPLLGPFRFRAECLRRVYRPFVRSSVSLRCLPFARRQSLTCTQERKVKNQSQPRTTISVQLSSIGLCVSFAGRKRAAESCSTELRLSRLVLPFLGRRNHVKIVPSEKALFSARSEPFWFLFSLQERRNWNTVTRADERARSLPFFRVRALVSPLCGKVGRC